MKPILNQIELPITCARSTAQQFLNLIHRCHSRLNMGKPLAHALPQQQFCFNDVCKY